MLMASTTLLIILFLQVCCNAKELPKFPATLIFGDSTVDTGNNNYIPTIAKGNYPPYGVNLPGHNPTGRFSDGKLVTDMLVSVLGIKKTLPPFLDPNLSDDQLVTGAVFASGGSGFDELTTAPSGAIPMAKQLELFQGYQARLKRIVGEIDAERIVSGALVIVSAGTNDFLFNYYDIPAARKLAMDINQYQDFLLAKLENFVERLYDLGCRLMLISGTPPIGCLPIQRTLKSPKLRQCIDEENLDSESYNRKLQKMLLNLQEKLQGTKIVYSDSYTPLMDLILNSEEYGFVEATRGCCGTGELEVAPFCNPLTPICPNPSQYIFFDSIHPTQAAYTYISNWLIKHAIIPNF